MQAEERDLIGGLYERLRAYDAQPRDAEAELLIGDLVSRQPSAPYLLTQTVLVQEQALKTAQARISELEARMQGGGFLGSAPNLGPWGAKPTPPAASATAALNAPPPGPQGGGFLRSALATAAGVAGGALLFEGIRNMFGQGPVQAASPYLPPDQGASTSSLLPPDQFSSGDVARDDGADDDYDTIDDNSGFDDSNGI
jgi:hypothetical protein